MDAKSFALAWITVNDLKQAVKFYTEIVGLKVVVLSEEYGWAELQGHEGGARLGIGQMREEKDLQIRNAVPTFSVENIEKAREEVVKKGAKCLGPIEEVPGHVKMQMIIDSDGNHFQLVQVLD
jgi:predicted enzyme related to lactoylglutathione lyase